MGEAQIFLKSISKENNYYKMEFDYKLEGVPIYYTENREYEISSPITIKANSERILECRWVIRYFTQFDKSINYNMNFADLLNKQILSAYPEILESKDRFFKRIEPGYIFELNDSDSVLLAPNWIISTDSKNYIIPLLRKGG
ncbi:MAG: hypothetical protein GX625_04720 [Clostridiaceae bacterium]|nr:hypothetical protein [Clostridiaceae bacterium]